MAVKNVDRCLKMSSHMETLGTTHQKTSVAQAIMCMGTTWTRLRLKKMAASFGFDLAEEDIF